MFIRNIQSACRTDLGDAGSSRGPQRLDSWSPVVLAPRSAAATRRLCTRMLCPMLSAGRQAFRHQPRPSLTLLLLALFYLLSLRQRGEIPGQLTYYRLCRLHGHHLFAAAAYDPAVSRNHQRWCTLWELFTNDNPPTLATSGVRKGVRPTPI